jgi:hypothetical protein
MKLSELGEFSDISRSAEWSGALWPGEDDSPGKFEDIESFRTQLGLRKVFKSGIEFAIVVETVCLNQEIMFLEPTLLVI